MTTTPIVKLDCEINNISLTCKARRNRAVLAMVELEYEDWYGGFYSKNNISIAKDARIVLLTAFKSKERGLGRRILCKSLNYLAKQGFTHIMLNAIPEPQGLGTRTVAQLMNYYKKLGFRHKTNTSGGLMIGTMKTVSARCKYLSDVIDNIAMIESFDIE